MGTHRLICHPDTPARAVEGIWVEWEPKGRLLWLRFHAELDPDSLCLPPPADPVRMDRLWQTTCFEAFVRQSGRELYREFNFSPSSRWAAYSFESYRAGMAELAVPDPPDIGLDAGQEHFALEAEIPLPEGRADLALCAVIEEKDGTKSYWALAHPPGKPDFHNPACFVVPIGPAAAP